MNALRPTIAGRYLFWLVVQSWLLLPMGLDQFVVEGFQHDPWPVRLLDVAFVAGGGFLIARNLVRLWQVPACGSSRATVVGLVLVGLLWLLFAAGPILESERWSTRPLGYAYALIGAGLAVIGTLHERRLRRWSSTTPSAGLQTPSTSH